MSWCIHMLEEQGVVDKDVLSQIKLYVGCTGGVRMLPLPKRKALLEELRRYLASSKSPFFKSPYTVRVISAEEEGVYGWLAANYLSDAKLPPPMACTSKLCREGIDIEKIGAMLQGSAGMPFTPTDMALAQQIIGLV